MDNSATLFWGLLFSSIGLGYFVYGKKQSLIVPLVVGIALMVFPYFVASEALTALIGIVLMVLPFIFKY